MHDRRITVLACMAVGSAMCLLFLPPLIAGSWSGPWCAPAGVAMIFGGLFGVTLTGAICSSHREEGK